MFCPKCNAENPDSSKFCTACGAPLTQPEPPQTPAQPEIPQTPAQPEIPQTPAQPENLGQQFPPQQDPGYPPVNAPYYYGQPYGAPPAANPYAEPQSLAPKRNVRGSVASLVTGIIGMLTNFATFLFTISFWSVPLALQEGTLDFGLMGGYITADEMWRAMEMTFNVLGFLAIFNGVVAFALGLMAVLFSVKAKRGLRAEPGVYKGSGIATGGRVTGILALIGVALCLVLSGVFYSAIY